MKLALIFLVSFVGLSWAERYIWPSPLAPRAHLMPLFYADGHPAEVIHSNLLKTILKLTLKLKQSPSAIKQDSAAAAPPSEEKFLFGLLPPLPTLLPTASPIYLFTTTAVHETSFPIKRKALIPN